MISCFPAPYPDEVLYSVVARYHLSSGNPIFRQTMDELFGVKKTALSMVLPQRLNVLADRVPSLPFERLLLEHTMYPYYMAFTSLKMKRPFTPGQKRGRLGALMGFSASMALPAAARHISAFVRSAMRRKSGSMGRDTGTANTRRLVCCSAAATTSLWRRQ